MIKHEVALMARVTPTIDALVTLTLDPKTVKSENMRITHHTEQGSAENYNRELMGFTFKKWQADKVSRHRDIPEVEAFRRDKRKESIDYGDR
jgi:hypothetical protein